MKILGHRIVASAFGAVAVLGLSLGAGLALEAAAPLARQVGAGAGAAPKAAGAGAGANQPGAVPRAAGAGPNIPPWTALRATPQNFVSAQGMWAEVIASTSRWIVVQNQEGQQFPIAADRIRQFLVRWPSSVGDLSPASMVEATGLQTGANTLMVDHIDVYEADAQNLVSPTVQNLSGGNNRPPPTLDSLYQGGFGITNWMEVRDQNTSQMIMHVVGRSTGINPVQLSGFGPTSVMVVPGSSGMSVTQVTLGTNSFAKKGDLVHLTPETALPRSLDVSQLVLYKKIPLRQFQP